MNGEAKKRYKDIDFPYTCPITSRVFKSPVALAIYATKTLKIQHDEYYDKYINHRDNICFFCGGKGKFISISKGYRNLCENQECVKKSFNSHSVEGIMYRKFVSREEAEILFNEENERQLNERVKTQNKLRKEDPLWDKKRSRNCKEFWIEKGFSKEESEIKVIEVMEEIHDKTSIKLKSDPSKYASKYPTKVEYYISRGFTIDEAKEKISKIQNKFSLDKCIDKYGDIEGMRIWTERQLKWKTTMDSKTEEEKLDILKRKSAYCKKNYSWISQKLFWKVYDSLEDREDIYFKELNTEYVISGKKVFIYDFLCKKRKKIIEFNGDYWHCNPSNYNENYYHTHLKMYAKERWASDELRKKITEENGYKILTIWESEYRKNPDETLQKCINFLNE